ncbi:hypothetical protein [Planomicrobium okeanokoites]|uniref:hypothetical protein n=1 Tax=Planomicrobium okeanokoites TaxID=244 RepID=UPI0009FFA6BF|nr:hypothetical protein [Planomicrobium okeanokoites]
MDLIRFLFFKKKHLVHTAFGQDSYYRTSSRLNGAGIDFDAKLKITAKTFDSSTHMADQFVRNAIVDTTEYDFFVQKEDKYKAEQALTREN